MKKRTKLICTALAVFFAFSAVAASAQAADQWYVGPKGGPFVTIPVGNNVPIKGTSGVSTLAVPALGFTIECKKDVITGSIQNANTAGVVEAHVTAIVHFKECQIKGVSTAVCQVKSPGSVAGEITTKSLTGKVNTTTGKNKAHAVFSPSEGTAFTEIEILGEECAFLQAEAVKVTGAVEGSVSPEGEKEAQQAVITFPSPALGGSTLKYGASTATFVSTETSELESGEWVVLK